MLMAKEIGVTMTISTGNEAASGVEDYVEYLLDEPNTRVIGMVVEQFRKPRRSWRWPSGRATRARRSSSSTPASRAPPANPPPPIPAHWLATGR